MRLDKLNSLIDLRQEKRVLSCFCFALLLLLSLVNGNSVCPCAKADSNGSWTAKLPIPTSRYNLGLVAVNNKIYAIGGQRYYTPYGPGLAPDAYSNSTDEYDPSMNTWTSKTSMPVRGSGFGIAVANNKVYTFGVGRYNCTFEYDPLTDLWVEKAQLPYPYAVQCRAATVNNVIYVFQSSESYVWKYDPTADSWTSRSPIPNPMWSEAYSNAVTINNSIYLIGGDEAGHLNQVYDVSTNTWDLKTSLPTIRTVFGTAALNGKIYVIGGHGRGVGTPYLNVNEVYDPVTDTWSTATPMPTPRGGIAAAAIDDKIYVVGGYNKQGDTDVYLTKNEEFTIPEFSFFFLIVAFVATTSLAAKLYKKKQPPLARIIK